METPFVSVIIPVYNDYEGLKLCLNALQNQTYSKDCCEIIVVDNHSEEDISSQKCLWQSGGVRVKIG